MHLILKCGERWGVIEIGKNPVALVRVKDASKRLKRPQILEVGQVIEMLKHLPEPYRTMVMVAQCAGLCISEILGLQWGDFDFEAHTFLVQRSYVGGRVDAVKTEYSKDYVPLDLRVEALLLKWRSSTGYSKDEDWVFANPRTGSPSIRGVCGGINWNASPRSSASRKGSDGIRSVTRTAPGWMRRERR